MILYKENPTDPTRKLLEFINEFSNISEYKKIIHRNLLHSYTLTTKDQKEKLRKQFRSSHCDSALTNQTGLVSMRMWVQSLALFSGLRIWHCCELWCRSTMWLRSVVAVAVVEGSSCSSNLTPRLGTSICHVCGPKKTKKMFLNNNNNKRKEKISFMIASKRIKYLVIKLPKEAKNL